MHFDFHSSHDGEFLTIIDLPEGEYQYRFYVDGNMCVDNNEVKFGQFIITHYVACKRFCHIVW